MPAFGGQQIAIDDVADKVKSRDCRPSP